MSIVSKIKSMFTGKGQSRNGSKSHANNNNQDIIVEEKDGGNGVFYFLIFAITFLFSGAMLGFFNTYFLPELIKLSLGFMFFAGIFSISVSFILPIPIALNLSSALKKGTLKLEALFGFALLAAICVGFSGGVLGAMQNVSKADLYSNFSKSAKGALLGTGAIYQASNTATATVRNIYTAKKGDTLSGIAQKYNVKLNDLIALNGGKKTVNVGQIVKIP